MAQTIKIKRSTGTAAPATLAQGELAYSKGSDTFYVGDPAAANTPIPIGGAIKNNAGTPVLATGITAEQIRSLIAVDLAGTDNSTDQNIWYTITADTGTTSANTTTDSLAIVGGTGISTSISGDTLTITNTAAAGALGGLNDVTITSVADNELLAYNTATSEWINQTPAEAGFATVATSGSYSDLSNTPTIPAAAANATITLTAGTGLSGGGDFTTNQSSIETITFTNADPGSAQNIFKNIAVTGQSTVVAESNNDTLTFVGGSNVTITTNATSDTITFAATDTNTTYTNGSGLLLNGTVFSHDDTSSQASVTNTGRTYIQSVDLDAFGHVTGITSATETVVNTDVDVNTTNLTARLPQLVSPTIGNGTGTITINGNLTVSGTTTTVSTETLLVADNIITLNSNSAATPTENAGIEVERGSSTNTALRWNEGTDRWEFTNDGTVYNNIPLPSEYATGDITGVTAGVGLVGGGTSGTVTLDLDFSELTDMTANISGTTEFILQNGTVESRKAASEITLSSFNNDAGWTSNIGDITGVTAGVGLAGGGVSGDVTLSLDFSELTDMTANISGTTEFILQNAGTESRKAASEITLSSFNNDSGFTTNTGTVTSVAISSTDNSITGGGTITTAGTFDLQVGTIDGGSY